MLEKKIMISKFLLFEIGVEKLQLIKCLLALNRDNKQKDSLLQKVELLIVVSLRSEFLFQDVGVYGQLHHLKAKIIRKQHKNRGILENFVVIRLQLTKTFITFAE